MKMNLLAVFSIVSTLCCELSGAKDVNTSRPAVSDDHKSAVFHGRTQHNSIMVESSSTPSGVFNSGMMFLADQLDRNAILNVKTNPTVVANIVGLNDLDKATELGRLISEHLRHELQLRLWTLVDVRMSEQIIINSDGEFALSRDTKKLRGSVEVSNILTGTYTSTEDGVLINLRLLDSTTGRMLSTAQTRLVRDRFIGGLVGEKPAPVPVIKLSP